MKDLVHSWAVCQLFFSNITQPFAQKSHECALKFKTELWNTSLLFDLNYKSIDGSLAFSPLHSFYGINRWLSFKEAKI